MAEPVKYFWSHACGMFVDKTTGKRATGAYFTGDWREWFETLVEVILDVTNVAVRENDNKPIDNVELLCDPHVASTLSTSVLFTEDHDWPKMGTIGDPVRGVLCRKIPVRGMTNLTGTYEARLVQKTMSGAKLLGTVTVLDYHAPDAPKSHS